MYKNDFISRCLAFFKKSDNKIVNNNKEYVNLPKGKHLIIDARDVPSKALTDSKAVLKALVESVEECGATVLTTTRHDLGLFSSPGYALGIILDESHTTCHCYLNEKLLAIDVFTCGKTSPELVFKHFIKKIDIGDNYSTLLIDRFTDN